MRPTEVKHVWGRFRPKHAITVQSEAVCSSLPVSGLSFPPRILVQSLTVVCDGQTFMSQNLKTATLSEVDSNGPFLGLKAFDYQ